ncbi:MAG: hypothetical protein IJL64_07850 [Bacteroidales bacterium]|nr:hypothetical protein [Bacteroidales bacterium]
MQNAFFRAARLCVALLIVSLVWVGCGCTGGTTAVIEKFPLTDSLRADVWRIPAENYYPQAMVVSNGRLIVHNLKSDYLFQVFDLRTREFLYEDGEIGRGGNDFEGEPDRTSMCPDTEGFGIRVNHEWYRVAVGETGLRVLEKSVLADMKVPVNNALPLRDGWFCTESSSSDRRNKAYTFVNKDTREVFHATPFPQHVLKTNAKLSTDRAAAYAKNGVVHPSGDRFAAFYSRFKAFQILSDRGRVLKTVRVDITPFSVIYDRLSSRRFYGYISTPATDGEYIYALCAGSEEEENYDVAATELQVFDWNGAPVASYKLDHYVHHIAVSDRTVYAINTFKPNEIYVYSL